jgi:multidrug efflux pump subunit AcrA (membrane-fusion protein)
VAGQTVYRVIGDTGGLEAVVNLPVSALDLFVLGHQAELVVRPSGVARSAVVTEVGNAAGLSGLYPVTLALDDASDLRPGLRVEVAACSDAESNAPLSIPLTAYLSAPGTVGRVFVLDPSTGRIAAREVEIGAITDAGIEVQSGLEVGDLIVARGLPWLRDGQVVAPLGVGPRRFNE